MSTKPLINRKRVRILKEGGKRIGPVAYWMSRDQRAHDNWALLFAQEMALEGNQPLMVIFVLVPQFLEANLRHYGFMIKGLQEVQSILAEKNIPFFLLTGEPGDEIPRFIVNHAVSSLVADFDPLRIRQRWKKSIMDTVDIPFYEVDTHNLVPCWMASTKQEYAAYTLRPKVYRALSEFLEEFPPLRQHPMVWKGKQENRDLIQILNTLPLNTSVGEIHWLNPGPANASLVLRNFITKKLALYDERRNDPNQDGQSHLSPYLHFGQISAQRVALEVQRSSAPEKAKQAFLEELIVRRELSDNFCFYNAHYDSFEGFPEWARKSLADHVEDKRKYHYSPEQFEQAQTHDALWNASQMEMVKTGKMHGYMRMYWAKKILEWTRTPQEALDIALCLNNKYELDGRDPNGYVGVAWAVGGLHDRAWSGRPIFGKIRYMSRHGCAAKFNISEYISKIMGSGLNLEFP